MYDGIEKCLGSDVNMAAIVISQWRIQGEGPGGPDPPLSQY